MRVAFFTDSFRENLGGLTRAAIALHDRLIGSGHAVRVFTLPQTGGPIHAGDVRLVRAIPLRPVPGLPPDSHLAWDYRGVRRELAEWRPDVVHLHTVLPVSWLGLLAARSLGIPVVATYHANIRSAAVVLPAGRAVAVAAGRLVPVFYNRCDAVIAPSRFAAEELRRFGVRRPIAVISNGIDLDRFAPVEGAIPGHGCTNPGHAGPAAGAGPERTVTVLFVGRLSPDKGVDTLVEALDIALSEEPGLRARIAGDGPRALAVRRALAPHVAAGRVTLLGHVPWEAMPAEYRSADLLLFPSPTETQGLAVLEAMASGLPVVAARAGALPEVVRDGVSGITAAPGDAEALARAVLLLTRDPALRRRLGAGARAVAGEHEAGRVLEQVLALYAQVMGGRSGSAEVGGRGAA
ncbi:MAG: glycosyltransferase [Clostridiales bacterium]|nr:glycosyltransferase [Clostridiales bacterium]